MKKTTNNDGLSTIYIISKGRPQCKTAETLQNINYEGDWFIVCGNNDETLPEYIKKWGEDKVLVFDWYEEIKKTDVMDNFGFEKMPSGAAPVRNAVFDFSRARGERRHWQMDDDFFNFSLVNVEMTNNKRIDGHLLHKWLKRIAQYAENAKLSNIGIALREEVYPSDAKTFTQRVYGTHNMSNDPEITPRWKGRFNDDTIHGITVHRLGKGKEMNLKFISVDTPNTQQDDGGLTEMYKELGTVRKTAYLILIAPNATKLVIHKGRYHHRVDWSKLVVKTISEKWKK